MVQVHKAEEARRSPCCTHLKTTLQSAQEIRCDSYFYLVRYWTLIMFPLYSSTQTEVKWVRPLNKQTRCAFSLRLHKSCLTCLTVYHSGIKKMSFSNEEKLFVYISYLHDVNNKASNWLNSVQECSKMLCLVFPTEGKLINILSVSLPKLRAGTNNRGASVERFLQ